MNVNTRIKNLREEFNIDQKTLADKIGLNASVMNRIELGTRPVRDEELSKIADYFGVSREEFNIDQKTLADKIGLNASVMNRIELGTRPVRDEELSKIADYFGVSVDYLLGRTNIRNYEENTIAAHTDDRTQQLSEEGRKRLDDFIDYLIFEEMKKKND